MRETIPRPALRERLALFGEEKLSDVECLAILVRTGTRDETAEQLSARLLQEFGGLAGLARAGCLELSRVRGLKMAKGAVLAAAFGLARRLCERTLFHGQRFSCAKDVARFFWGTLRGSQREQFHACYLDTKHRVLSSCLVSIGSLETSIVHPREVFQPAIRQGAAALVVGHNHPSGDPLPSPADREVTERLRQVGLLVGIDLLDHLVIGDRSFYSFADDRVAEVGEGREDEASCPRLLAGGPL
jgi:DNA repair protein RadC